MTRAGWIALVGVATLAAFAVSRLVHGHVAGREVQGGRLMPNVGVYDRLTRLLLGSRYRSIAADIAATASPSARILEVGCGPGHLAVALARDHGLEVTGLDLDPDMIARARSNADRSGTASKSPTFVVGDAAALPFSDGTFDLVVSTFSMHHWSDPTAGLDDIARVLRPDGKALIWDFRAGFPLPHAHSPDPAAQVHTSRLRLISVKRWRWPWRLELAQRLELAPDQQT
jgi:ubiquinone/menaquinone biosynthesis C-methylase UbiE